MPSTRLMLDFYLLLKFSGLLSIFIDDGGDDGDDDFFYFIHSNVI